MFDDEEVQRRMEGLDQLQAEWSECTRCPLHLARQEMGQTALIGSGSLFPKIMLIVDHPLQFDMDEGWGKSPSDDFFFDKIFSKSGISRDDVWITSLAACRPMDDEGRTVRLQQPTIDACQPRLAREIAILDPLLILLMGERAFKTLTGSTETFGASAGHPSSPLFFVRVKGATGITVPYPAYVTYSPRDLATAAGIQVSHGRKAFAPNQKCWFAASALTAAGNAVRALNRHYTGSEEPEEVL